MTHVVSFGVLVLESMWELLLKGEETQRFFPGCVQRRPQPPKHILAPKTQLLLWSSIARGERKRSLQFGCTGVVPIVLEAISLSILGFFWLLQSLEVWTLVGRPCFPWILAAGAALPLGSAVMTLSIFPVDYLRYLMNIPCVYVV